MLLSSGPYPTTDTVSDDLSTLGMDTLVDRLLQHKASDSTVDLKNDWDQFTRVLHGRMITKIF